MDESERPMARRGRADVDLPVHEIKIDKSFIVHLVQDKLGKAIVHSIVDLGQRMALRVVAEGVEDEATWTWLGCDTAQG